MKSKIQQMPGTKLSPETLLRQVLEDKNHIVSVVVVVELDSNEMETRWSNMSKTHLCMASTVLQQAVFKTLGGEYEFSSLRGDDAS